MWRPNSLYRYLNLALVILLAGAFLAACTDDGDGEETPAAGVAGTPATEVDTTPTEADGGTPDTAGTPDTTGTAGMAGTPDTTGTPGMAGTPDMTGTPDTTGTPGTSGTPDATSTPATTGTPDATGTPTSGTAIDDILEDPDAYVGQDVTVVARVDSTMHDMAFELSSRNSDDHLLVIAMDQTLPQEFSDGAAVMVSGVVEIFDPEDPRLQGVDLSQFSDIDFSDREGDPVLIADDVEVLIPAAGGPIDQIHDDTDAYVGRTVTVVARVDEVVDGRAYVVGANRLTNDILIITDTDDASGAAGTPEATGTPGTTSTPGASTGEVAEGAWIRVTGTVQEFNQENEADWEERFTGLFDDDTFADWEGDPVILADEFEVLAPADSVAKEDILDDTDSYVGQDVTVSGRVVEIHSSRRAFTIDGDDDLLVIGTQDIASQLLLPGVVVVVDGTVERFDAEDTSQYPGLDGSATGTSATGTGTPGTGTSGTGTPGTGSATGTPGIGTTGTGTPGTNPATGTPGTGTGTPGTGAGTTTGTPGAGVGLDLSDFDLDFEDYDDSAVIIAESIEIIAIDD